MYHPKADMYRPYVRRRRRRIDLRPPPRRKGDRLPRRLLDP
jgi:hypothetical protein